MGSLFMWYYVYKFMTNNGPKFYGPELCLDGEFSYVRGMLKPSEADKPHKITPPILYVSDFWWNILDAKQDFCENVKVLKQSRQKWAMKK